MNKKVYKITQKELDEMIAEEVRDVKEMARLKKELKSINEQLAALETKRLDEEKEISEVEVGGRKSGDEWYEKDLPVAKFEKKGTHLKEEEMEEESFEEKMAAIGRELDAKLAGVEGEDIEDMEGMEDMEDVEDVEDLGDIEDVEDMEDVEECGTIKELSEEEVNEEETVAEEESVNEEVIEISEDEIVAEDEAVNEEEVNEEEVNEDEVVEEQDGESVANAASESRAEDYMDKTDNKNPMADKMYEGEKSAEEEIISEGKEGSKDVLGLKNNKILAEEISRMKQLLG